jgi:hypothetical protein
MIQVTPIKHAVHHVASHKLFLPCQVMNQMVLMGMRLTQEHSLIPTIGISFAMVFLVIAVIDHNEMAVEVADND